MSVQDCDFRNAKVYKIVDNVSDMLYVGSTCYSLEDRLKGHESTFKTFQKGKKANCLTSFKILQNKDYRIELIENFPCENSKQLFEREGFYIRKYKNDGLNIVNKTTLGLTWEEQRKKSHKTRTQKFNCECGGKFTGQTKSCHLSTQKHRKYMTTPKIIIPGNNNIININIYCQSKEDVNDLQQLEQDFLNALK